MAIRASRIAWVSVAVIAMAVMWLWQNARERPSPLDPNAAPWIGLPKSGMDATQQSVRQVIDAGLRSDGADPTQSLAFQCGSEYGPVPIKERYVAHIGPNIWGPYWKVVFNVSGQQIDVSLKESSQLFMPPPPPPPDYRAGGATLFSETLRVSKARADLVRIRDLWSDARLWQAPQDIKGFSCSDGDPVFLEACVDGRYAARLRNCDPAVMETTNKLLQTFKELLPSPPKPEWRDATGNPIPDNWSLPQPQPAIPRY
jgi:hypothetical protein